MPSSGTYLLCQRRRTATRSGEDECSVASGGSLIDVTETEKLWSSDRSQRYQNKERKVWGCLEGPDAGPLRGGDWVVNSFGDGVTLSFCVQYKSKWYGLTTGHMFDLEEDIYVFTGAVNGQDMAIKRVGKGVSLSRETD
jgi:hypothetical protein